jgi:hypothetical protein
MNATFAIQHHNNGGVAGVDLYGTRMSCYHFELGGNLAA